MANGLARQKLFIHRYVRRGQEHYCWSSVTNVELEHRKCPESKTERWLNNLGQRAALSPELTLVCLAVASQPIFATLFPLFLRARLLQYFSSSLFLSVARKDMKM